MTRLGVLDIGTETEFEAEGGGTLETDPCRGGTGLVPLDPLKEGLGLLPWDPIPANPSLLTGLSMFLAWPPLAPI